MPCAHINIAREINISEYSRKQVFARRVAKATSPVYRSRTREGKKRNGREKDERISKIELSCRITSPLSLIITMFINRDAHS